MKTDRALTRKALLLLTGVAVLGLAGCGASIGYGDYFDSPSTKDVRDGTVGDIAAVATDTLLALGGPSRTLIDQTLVPVTQRPREGLAPVMLDLAEQYMSVRAPVSGSNGAGQQVFTGTLACSSGTGSLRNEFLSPAVVNVGDTLTITTQNCVLSGQSYSGIVVLKALSAASGMPGVSPVWNGRWSAGFTAWTQSDLLTPPIGSRAQGAAELQMQRIAIGHAEVSLRTVETAGQLYGLSLALIENGKSISDRGLSGVAGWRELAGNSYTSLDFTVSEAFFAAQGLPFVKVRTSAETVSLAGALPSGTWYALAPDNSVAYITERNGSTGPLLVDYAQNFGGALEASFETSWKELSNYI